jgi:peptidoglycan/LPS O-acetylase OafA/YrhL
LYTVARGIFRVYVPGYVWLNPIRGGCAVASSRALAANLPRQASACGILSPMRIPQIDALRGVAVLLVVGSHLTWNSLLSRVGWVGVDLFFVLSGFLISGLLFAEFQKTGRLRIGRFLIRRGLKIYPAYYLVLALTIAGYWRELTWSRIWPDLIFVQSYRLGTWGHFWSLAVEEHFYVLLPVLLALAIRRGQRQECRGRPPADPFARLPWLFLALAAASLLARSLPVWFGVAYDFRRALTPSHLRMDGLGFGVLLSYFVHFRPGLLGWWLVRRRLLLAGSLLLVSPAIWLEQSNPIMYTVGLTWLYLGFGGLLVFAVSMPACGHLTRVLAAVGRYSYTVYLVHMPVAVWAVNWLNRRVGRDLAYLGYLGISLGLGLGLWRVVEAPALAVRERLYPAG